MGKNVLYIAAHLPTLLYPQGGHKTAATLLDGYVKAGDAVTAIIFLNPREREAFDRKNYSFLKEAYVFPVNNRDRVLRLLRRPWLPFSVVFRADSKAVRLIRRLLRENHFDIAHFEFTASGFYRRFVPDPTETVISEHDVTYQSYIRKRDLARGIKKLLYSFELRRQKKWELGVLGKCSQIWAHNTKDRELLIRDGVSAERIKVITPYVDPVFKSARRDRVEKGTILFWGAMDRPENEDAALWFAEEIFPAVLKMVPHAVFTIVGVRPGPKVLALASNHIRVTGFVEDPLPYFEKARVAVAPLRLGAGIKIKVLECLTAGLPIVTTSIGAEGIPARKEMIIAEGAGAIAEEIIKILI